MSKEYESLTAFIPKLKESGMGEWIIDKKNDGTPEHPKHMPFVHYDEAVIGLEEGIYQFVDDHEDTGIRHYQDYLENKGIEYRADAIANLDVSELDGLTVVVLMLSIIRQDRFCEGLMLEFCNNGCMTKWLNRLKEIDDSEE